MRFNKTMWPDVILYSGVCLLFLFLFISFGLFRDARKIERRTDQYSKILDSTTAERRQLQRYEATKEGLAAASDEAFSEKQLFQLAASDIPAADSQTSRKLEPVDGFQGRRLDCFWKVLDKRTAFQILMALQSKQNTCWHLSEMKLEALPDGNRVSFRLLLETATPFAGELDSY